MRRFGNRIYNRLGKTDHNRAVNLANRIRHLGANARVIRSSNGSTVFVAPRRYSKNRVPKPKNVEGGKLWGNPRLRSGLSAGGKIGSNNRTIRILDDYPILDGTGTFLSLSDSLPKNEWFGGKKRYETDGIYDFWDLRQLPAGATVIVPPNVRLIEDDDFGFIWYVEEKGLFRNRKGGIESNSETNMASATNPSNLWRLNPQNWLMGEDNLFLKDFSEPFVAMPTSIRNAQNEDIRNRLKLWQMKIDEEIEDTYEGAFSKQDSVITWRTGLQNASRDIQEALDYEYFAIPYEEIDEVLQRLFDELYQKIFKNANNSEAMERYGNPFREDDSLTDKTTTWDRSLTKSNMELVREAMNRRYNRMADSWKLTQDQYLDKMLTGFIDPQAYRSKEDQLDYLVGDPDPLTEVPDFLEQITNGSKKAYIPKGQAHARPYGGQYFDTWEEAEEWAIYYANSERNDYSSNKLPGRGSYPKLLKSIDGIEYRQTGRKLNYASNKRDSEGKAILLTDAEKKMKGLPLVERTIVAFDGDKPVGYIADEWGVPGVWVIRDYQNRNIGLNLADTYAEEGEKIGFRYSLSGEGALGQATPAGRKLAARYHKLLVERALKAGKDVPEDVLQDYPDLLLQYEMEGQEGFV